MALAETSRCQAFLTAIWNRGDQSLREVFTWTKGSIELQFGGEVLRIRLPMGNQYQESGIFEFSNDLSGDNLSDFHSVRSQTSRKAAAFI